MADRWTYRQTDDGQTTNRQKDGQTGRLTDRQRADRLKLRLRVRPMNRQKHRQMGRQTYMNTQKGRQT